MAAPFDIIMGLDFESSWGRAVKLGFSCQTMEEYIRDPRFKAWGLSWSILDLKTGEHHEVWVRRKDLPAFFARFPFGIVCTRLDGSHLSGAIEQLVLDDNVRMAAISAGREALQHEFSEAHFRAQFAAFAST